MKIRASLLLAALALIHLALFISHANTSPYLWAIDLLIAAICLLSIVSDHVDSISRSKPKRKPTRPLKMPYSKLSIHDLLKCLQDLNEQERLIEKELELRYPETNLKRA